ncbi:MAG: DUF6625 family protein [Bacteroidota bacterium]
MRSLRLLTTWSGPLPAYLPLFLKTAAGNPTVDFVFVADAPAPPELPANVTWVERAFPDLLAEMGAALGVRLPAGDPYKMCDLKPTFGVTLAHLIGDADFWGHIDCDLVLGDLRASFTDAVLGAHDLLTLRGRGIMHGPLTVYRNTDPVNRLFEQAAGWRETLSLPRCAGFDETCGWRRWKGEPRPEGTPESMTDAAMRAVAAGAVCWYDPDHVKESAPYRSMDVRWEQRDGLGRLTDEHARSLAFYHLLFAKDDRRFRIPTWPLGAVPEAFTLTRWGVRPVRQPSAVRSAVSGIWAAPQRVRAQLARLVPKARPGFALGGDEDRVI